MHSDAFLLLLPLKSSVSKGDVSSKEVLVFIAGIWMLTQRRNSFELIATLCFYILLAI